VFSALSGYSAAAPCVGWISNSRTLGGGVAGTDHQGFYLTEEEQALNNQFTPCCSRSKGAMLVLEL